MRIRGRRIILSTERVCQLIAILVGARCAVIGTHNAIINDGISYIEIARGYLRHDWHNAVSAFWGPLYSWGIALAIYLFHPGIRQEGVMLQGVNFVFYLFALWTFGIAWRTLGARKQISEDGGNSLATIWPAGWTVFGYTIFLATFVWYVNATTPDVLVAGIVFAIVAMLCRLFEDVPHSTRLYVAFGLLLGFGYYAKVILFPFALFILAALALHGIKTRSFLRVSVAAAIFAITVLPFVIAVSYSVGHLSVGETGRLNYAWQVNLPETKDWMGDTDSGTAMPFYPGPPLHHSPPVYGVPLLPEVSYAPWFNPARFDTGAHPHFDLARELRRLAISLKRFKLEVVQNQASLVVVVLVFFLYSPTQWWRRFRANWFYVVPTLMIVAMYCSVYVSWRYLLAFMPLLWGAALLAAAIPSGSERSARLVLVAGIAVFAAQSLPGFLGNLVTPPDSAQPEIRIAESLPSYGVHHGDLVAILGDGQAASWAHLAKVSVVAEIWSRDVPAFWASSPANQRTMIRAMAGRGAKAVVWRRDSGQLCPVSWQELPADSGCILVISAQTNQRY